MILNNQKISEGIVLSTIKTDKFKSSVISFSLTFPMTKEAVAYNTLLSHLLMQGTKKYPSLLLLNKRLDELYGSYIEIKSHNIGRNVSLAISAELLENKYVIDGTDIIGEVISIICELILSPAFIQDDFNKNLFEQEKRRITDSIDAEINNTRAFATRRCIEMMYDGIDKPTSQELKKLVSEATLDALLAHYQSFIANTPIKIFYVGAENGDVITDKIKKAFKSHLPSASFSLIPPTPISLPHAKEKTVKMPISQGKLALGFSTNTVMSNESDEFYAMILLNEIFGGSASSKLFCNVREKLNICYYCSSSYSIYSGVMLVSSGFEVKNYDIARVAILEQLDDIKRGRISDSEFIAAKKSIIHSYRQLQDSPLDMQAFFGDRALFGITDTLDVAQEKFSATSKDDVVAVASNITLSASFFIEGNGESEEGDVND